MTRLLRASAAAIGAAATLVGIAAYGSGMTVGLYSAPVAAVVAFGASWALQRWRLGGFFGQETAIILTTVMTLAAIAALIFNQGSLSLKEWAAGMGLAAYGAFIFWPAVAAGIATYVALDQLIARRG